MWWRVVGWVWVVLEVLLSTCQCEHSCLQGLRVRHCFSGTPSCVMPACPFLCLHMLAARMMQ